MRSRLLERSRLSLVAASHRAPLKTVTVNGAFDLLHVGHLHILEEARRQGDVLIVGINSDASVARLKGASRPFNAEIDRAMLLLALRCVDYVHVFDEDNPVEFLQEVKPDVHVNGSEYGEDCVESPVVKKYGGRIHTVERLPGVSTSELAKKVWATTDKNQVKQERFNE